MQLTVPQRSVADTGSFPVDPEGVERWLETLRPLVSSSDASEIYRGLKHSNRLHNDVDQRRSVLRCFIPILRSLHEQLEEITQAQPLPLTREFARSARLADALLREEAFAFKILLLDSDVPRADDARRAMQALARQALEAVRGYRRLPQTLIRDAHQLYAMAERRDLLEAERDELRSTLDHYRHILLLGLIDTRQIRIRQLPLLLEWIHESVHEIDIRTLPVGGRIGSDIQSQLAIHLEADNRPEPLASLRLENRNDIRTIGLSRLLARIEQRIAEARPSLPSLMGADALDRQTLSRVRISLAHGLPAAAGRLQAVGRQRRSARIIRHENPEVVFGHKEISAHLLYAAERDPAHPVPPPNPGNWVKINESQHGACIVTDSGRAGRVQPGELVCLGRQEPSNGSSVLDEANGAGAQATPHGRQRALLGVVRWVHASGDSALEAGIEYLARSVLPVTVQRSDGESHAAEPAMIIGCKVREQTLQTILLPAYLFQIGDALIAAQGGRSRRFALHLCLQTNGLFSQFSLKDHID